MELLKKGVFKLIILCFFILSIHSFVLAQVSSIDIDLEKINFYLIQNSQNIKLNCRAALVFLKAYEKTEDLKYLSYAENALKSVLSLQKEDGSFNNPCDDLAMAQAFLSISSGARLFKEKDEVFSSKLLIAADKTYDFILKGRENLEKTGQYKDCFGWKIPGWLLCDSPRISAIFAMGLLEYCQVKDRSEFNALIESLGDGISQSNLGDFAEYPFNAHFLDSANINCWSLQDNYITAFLAKAGKKLNKPSWIRSAEEEAGSVYAHLVSSFGIVDYYPHPVIVNGDIWQVSHLVSNSMEVYKATGKEPYLVMAALASSFAGTNKENLEDQLALLDISIEIKDIQNSDYLDFKEVETFSFSVIDAVSGKWVGKIYDIISYAELFKEASADQDLTSQTQFMQDPAHGSILSSRSPLKNFRDQEGAQIPPYKVQEPILKVNPYYLKLLEGQNLKLLERKAVVLNKDTIYWHKLSIPDDSFYLLYLVFLNQPGFSMNISAGVRVDGHTIYTIPMASEKIQESFMAMKKISVPFHFDEGFHTVGIKYNGLQFSHKGYVDCLVAQPVVERKLFRNSKGENLLFLKSFAPVEFFYGLPLKEVKDKDVKIKVYSYTGYLKEDKVIPSSESLEKIGVKVLGYGYTVVRW